MAVGRQLILQVCILLGCRAGAAAVQDTKSPLRRLQDAVRLQQAGRLEEAVAAYREYLARGEPLPEIWSNLGTAYAGLGDLREAVEAYQNALALAPTSADIQRNLGLAYYKMGKLGSARKWFARAGAARREGWSAALRPADVQFRQGEYETVIETLQPFREMASSKETVAYLVGTALIRSGRGGEGQLYVDAILRNGESGVAHLMLASAHVMGGDLRQAVAEVEKAIALEPSLPVAHSFRGRLLSAVERNAAAHDTGGSGWPSAAGIRVARAR